MYGDEEDERPTMGTIWLRVRDHRLPLLSTAITGFPYVALFAQTYVTKDDNPIAVPFHHFKKM